MYDGEWVKDLQHGKGTLLTANGFMYQGEFVEGFKEGKGKQLYPDGSEYTGGWKQNKRDCQEGGKLVSKNGDYYEGGWANDAKSGKGIMKVSNVTYEGSWKNGNREGQFFISLDDKVKGDYEIDFSRATVHLSGFDRTQKQRSRFSLSSRNSSKITIVFKDDQIISPVEYK
eukprot:CAMPEP_0201498838 /NCGR_PEP_ID=MMETSP0151_2-20130828/73262_1 /ASSEMBLY_ACC=CAM_ASM_000257 /TAXON_ID=200890 /ORGANISM="Paramoeba atlantica, Strain 621/1 / CCAP 1560/9" /LENGTH=170 /DNA_ID=CAMNT_0047890725 /DNA_START=33 /DNA_END=542 /DNA_ORIENTATION=+